MRTAADDRNRFRQIRFFRKDPLLTPFFVTFETSLSFCTIVTHSGYRNIDDAKNGLSRLYQGNIHGEFSIFIDELFCTVERIHQPKFTDRKSTRLNSSHVAISYAVVCLKKKKRQVASE